jgi:hypothetical protein
MRRTCTACTHPQRDEIDRLLLDGAALRNIAKRFSLSTASLFRHNKHIAKTLSNARQEAEILRADGLMEHLNHLTAGSGTAEAEGGAGEGLPDSAGRREGDEPTVGNGNATGGRSTGAEI